MDERKLYEMKLHESLEVGDAYTYILRVPGGWLYNLTGEYVQDERGGGEYLYLPPVFVPFNSEFQE